MKNMSRAYNRHKQNVKFLRRIKNWFRKDDVKRVQVYDSLRNKITNVDETYYEREYLIQQSFAGEFSTSFRTTGRPCNCDMCTYLKYERKSKGEIKKIIMDGLE
jgi:hypothetical protein